MRGRHGSRDLEGELEGDGSGEPDAFTRALRHDDTATLYDYAPCGFVTTGPGGEIRRTNATFRGWTGYQEVALEARPFSDLLTPGGRIYYETHVRPLLGMQGFAREIALELRCADDRRLPVLVNIAEVYDGQDQPASLQLAIFDATERREYERELLREKDRAEKSEEEARRLAQTLQQTLIPPTPPDIPGLDIAAAYRPAGSGAEVGGDFYDVFQVGPDDWVVALGDVCGKGVDAAVVTALVRYSLRATAARQPSPAEALQVLNRALLDQGAQRFATVVVLRLTRTGRGWTAMVAAGGHPLPLLCGADGAVSTVGVPGTLVGVFDEVSARDRSTVLEPGFSMLLYTDGVTESRRGRELFGDERLLACLEGGHPSSAAVVDHVLHEILEFQDGNPRDDIAVVAIRVAED